MTYGEFHAQLVAARLQHDEWKRALPMWKYRHDDLEGQATSLWCLLADRRKYRHMMNLKKLNRTLGELARITAIIRALDVGARKKAA